MTDPQNDSEPMVRLPDRPSRLAPADRPITPEQAALIAAVAAAEAEPTARNRALVRLASEAHFNATIERLEIEQGIRPPQPRLKEALDV